MFATQHRPILAATLVAFILIAGAFLAGTVLAQESTINFPVAELGGCEDKEACKAYCDKPANIESCVAFAEANGLMEPEEAEHARAFARAGGEGPGGCDSIDTCEAYCENINNIDECLAFGEQHGLIPPEELDEARKIADALKSGAQTPGGCESERECEAYCSDTGHIQECIAFAEATGILPPEELEEAKKIADYVAEGGEMPGGCTNERECQAYCEDDAHIDECVTFAAGAGLMSDEELELYRKTGGRGPGGCRGRECEDFCQQPENREACIQFAHEHDLLSEEEKRQMEKGLEQARAALREAPPEVLACIEEKIGSDAVEGIETGTFIHGPATGEAMRTCFDAYFESDEFKNFEGNPPGEEFDGSGRPGGSFDMPPDVAACAREIFGDNFLEQLRSGELDHNELERRVQECTAQRFENEGSGGDFDSSGHGDGFENDFDGNFDEHHEFDGEFPEDEFHEDEFHEGDFGDPSFDSGEFEYAQGEYYAEGSYDDSFENEESFDYAQAEYYAEGSYDTSTTDDTTDDTSDDTDSSLGAQVLSAIRQLFGGNR